jgi:hypothetical protein
MQWSDLPRDPPPRLLRQFAFLCLVFFGVLAWRAWSHRSASLAVVLGVIAVGAGLLGLARPRALRPIFVGWMVLAFPIGWLVSNILMGALFYIVFTPIALLFRILGRDALELRRREVTSYWSPKPVIEDPRRYLREY